MWLIFFKLDQIRNTAFGVITNRSAKRHSAIYRHELKTSYRTHVAKKFAFVETGAWSMTKPRVKSFNAYV